MKLQIGTIFLLVQVSANCASLINGGFETGDLTGWQALGGSNVTVSSGQSYPAAGGAVAPSSGLFASRLVSTGVTAADLAAAMGITEATLEAANGNKDATFGSMIYQTFNATAGDSVNFRWNFVEQDYLPYDDFAFYGLSFEGAPASVTKFASLESVGPDNGSTINGWEDLNLTFSQTGSYTAYFGVLNVQDSGLPSDLWIDGVGEPALSAIPEPGSMLALGLLISGGAFMRSRRRGPEAC